MRTEKLERITYPIDADALPGMVAILLINDRELAHCDHVALECLFEPLMCIFVCVLLACQQRSLFPSLALSIPTKTRITRRISPAISPDVYNTTSASQRSLPLSN